ncbi:hypothetical protein QZH41_013902, partial [Actinostola sp. cb2023]
GDPLFLALLQKRLSSSSYGNHVRPGFSPKRYIATLGRSLQEDSWNKLLTSGSFKDPALQSYNPYAPSVHDDGSLCELFPSKPQPYSTMSLPPISPSSSMLGSAFNFYPNGMSTGAASMISINSDEYAPSSRAISPAESLNERLSEVEPIRPKKDYRYASLDSKQKEELLSQMLVQKTLETVDSDLQTWPANFNKEDTYDSNASLTGTSKRRSSKGSLKSSSLTSIPRLPPIQSAGTDAGTRTATTDQDNSGDADTTKNHSESSTQSLSEAGSEPRGSFTSQVIEANDQSQPSTRRASEADSDPRVSRHSSAATDKDQESRDVVEPGNVAIDLSDESSHWGEALGHVIDNSADADDSQDDEEKKVLNLVKTLHDPSFKENEDVGDDIDKGSEDSIDLKDVQVTENQDDDQQENDDMTGSAGRDQLQDDVHSEHDGSKSTEVKPTDGDVQATGDVAEQGKQNEEQNIEQNELEKSVDGDPHSRSSTSLSIAEDHGPSPEPPPPITFEQLHNEARAVASRVLNRPQSGAVFMKDARAALAMWADRLSTLLDPPSKDARISSAAVFNRKPNQSTNGAGFVPAGHKRKISQSASPSLAALRHALLISGGELPAIESLKNLPPIQIPHCATASKHNSGVSHGHTYYETLKDGETRSSRASGSPGPTRSILTERLSNSDLQMDILNFVSNEELGFVEDRAGTAQDDESDDEEFRAALQAVVTDLQNNITSDQKHQIAAQVSTPPKDAGKKVKSPPFQVKRPVDEKPPPGLKTKQPGREKETKKVSIAKKDGKKTTKKGAKGTKKAEKPKVDKPSKKTAAKDKLTEPELKSVEDNRAESSELVIDMSPDTSVRVASEASKRLDDFSETPTLEPESMSSRPDSSKRSDYSIEQQQLSTKSPSVQSVHSIASVIEQPRLVPRPVEQEHEIDPEQERRELEELEAELSKKKDKEARAAKRAEERAAAAERRRHEVERKRREKEEAKRRQVEEEARLEKVRQEAEEEMKRREMEMRKKRDEREAEKRRKEEEEVSNEREERARIEREKRKREEYERKKQELIAQRKLEEEIRKEQEKLEAEIEEASRRAEEERIQDMEESERIAFLEKMRQEEEELRKRLEAERRIQEQQRRIQEEQRRMREEAIALHRQKRLQRHLFITGLIREGVYMSLSQRLSRAFTFSYFDNLPWSFLNNMRSVSPIKDLISELKQTIQPTIYEVDEEDACPPPPQ